jgi:DNA-binding protein
MRVRLIAIVVALMVVYGLLVRTGSLANQEPQPAGQRVKLSTHGRLLELVDDAGLTRNVGSDGFKVNYKVRGKIRSAFALAIGTKGLRTSDLPVKSTENTATATVRTSDKSLEITSTFTLNDTTGELIIQRKFRNISKHPVTLQMIRNQIDPGVMIKSGNLQSANLVSASLSQITAGFLKGPYDCGAGECPLGPICPPWGCPTPLPPTSAYSRARLYPSKNRVILGWSTQIVLKPKQKQRPADEASIVIRVAIK